MLHELKTEAFRKRRHLGYRNHLAPRAAQHHDVRVIDHDAGRGTSHVTQRAGELVDDGGAVSTSEGVCASCPRLPKRFSAKKKIILALIRL
jgi:hypothetical protein